MRHNMEKFKECEYFFFSFFCMFCFTEWLCLFLCALLYRIFMTLWQVVTSHIFNQVYEMDALYVCGKKIKPVDFTGIWCKSICTDSFPQIIPKI